MPREVGIVRHGRHVPHNVPEPLAVRHARFDLATRLVVGILAFLEQVRDLPREPVPFHPAIGRLALQLHGNMEMDVMFKDITLASP